MLSKTKLAADFFSFSRTPFGKTYFISLPDYTLNNNEFDNPEEITGFI
jgi:hypothetical protein